MSDKEYYLRRAQAERDLAAMTMSPEIRAIHEMLADRYGELARQDEPDGAPLIRFGASEAIALSD